MNDEKLVIDVEDYRGRRVIFTEKKWKEKSAQHPILRKTIFLKNIEKTVEDPEEVWEDYEDPKNRNCYYRKYSSCWYIKVVIWISSQPCRVITVYPPINRIKEKDYPELKNIR